VKLGAIKRSSNDRVSDMYDKKDLTNMKTVTVEINGQQESMIRKLVENSPHGLSAEEILRMGFLEYAKEKRLAKG
jgi:hypothetical protein